MSFALDVAPNALDLDDLVEVACGMAADVDRWRPRIQFRADSRWWTRLHGDNVLDVWLLTWLSDQSTDLHDHGGSAAAVTVVVGELNEGNLAGFREQRAVISVGESAAVPTGVVHDVRNPAGTPAISIHAYSPPLR